MDRIIKIYESFTEQEADEIRYWKAMPGDKKLEVLEMIRANYWAIKNETPGRLQRFYKIIKRSKS